MEIVLLGTGAADGWPNPFCQCVSCAAARAGGAAATRAHSSALVDRTLLLDAGPDVPLAASRHGIALDEVRALLLTHAHPDHVAPQIALWRQWAGASAPLRIVGPVAALDAFTGWLAPDAAVTFEPVIAGDSLDVDGYRVRVLAAAHGDSSTGPGVLYDVTAPDGGARLLYATDTGPLPPFTLAAIDDAAYDVVLLEETWGDVVDHGTDHLDLPSFAATVAELRRRGAVHERTTVAPIHLGHRNPPEAELAVRLAGWGVDLLADGAVLTVGDAVTRPDPARRALVTGGARSGKSRAAEEMVAACPSVTYVATAPADDDEEWRARVEAHRARRPAHWVTVESTDLAKVLSGAEAGDVLLIDCLTLWLTAVMTDCGCWDETRPAAESDAAVGRVVDELLEAWRLTRARVVAVTNEVGQGVVPATASGRRFRDAMGRLNAVVAAESDEVWLLTAGLRQRLR